MRPRDRKSAEHSPRENPRTTALLDRPDRSSAEAFNVLDMGSLTDAELRRPSTREARRLWPRSTVGMAPPCLCRCIGYVAPKRRGLHTRNLPRHLARAACF
jgi:hypothetical protein